MTAKQPNDNPRDPRLDDNDPVWDLLASAPLPEPHPWFTARTMARCREEISKAKSPLFSVGRVWRWALGGGGLGVCLAVTLMMTQTQTPAVSPSPDDQKNVQEAFEIVASVDSGSGSDTDSSTSSSSSSWQDSSSL